MKKLPAEETIVIPRGKLYLRPEKADGTLEDGYVYLGDASAFTSSGSTERTTVYSHTGPVREKLADVTTQIDRSATMTLQNINMENLSHALIGDSNTITQSSATASTETFSAVKPGRHYRLGESASNPYGVQQVSNVTVTIDPGGTATSGTEGTDYEVDTADGSVYVIPGGGISDGDSIEVTYDQAQVDVPVVDSNDKSPIRGDLWLSADNATGPNRDVRMPKVELTPDGDLPWISAQDNQTIQLAVAVSKRTGYEQAYVIER